MIHAVGPNYDRHLGETTGQDIISAKPAAETSSRLSYRLRHHLAEDRQLRNNPKVLWTIDGQGLWPVGGGEGQDKEGEEDECTFPLPFINISFVLSFVTLFLARLGERGREPYWSDWIPRLRGWIPIGDKNWKKVFNYCRLPRCHDPSGYM